MLGDLLSKAAGHGTAADLEAMTAERDFFREKYTEQMLKMNAMEEVLCDNQRTISKLRHEIMAAKHQQQLQQQQNSEGLTTTTASSSDIADDKVSSRRHDDTDNDEDGNDDDDDNEKEHSKLSANNHNDGGGSSHDNEAGEIRANAERMLQWAQYQSTKKQSSSESLTQQNSSSCSGDVNVVISANLLVDMGSDQDRDTSVTKEGKMSKLFDNLRDMISPSLSSDDDEECESDDESSCVSCDDK